MRKMVSIISIFLMSSLGSSLFAQNIQVHRGWQLKGTESGFSINSFNQSCIDTVWTYDSESGWSVYSPKSELQNEINGNSTLRSLLNIGKNQGFWIYANSDCDIYNSYAPPSIPNYDNNITCDNNISINSNLSVLTPDVIDGLDYMGNEERLAYDVYNKLYGYWNTPEVAVLDNVANRAEIRHIEIVQSLVRKYDINNTQLYDEDISQITPGTYEISEIQDLYNSLIAKGELSQQDALEVGCMVEVTDINDLDKYIQYAKDSNASDITNALESLRNGSYNHYWSFDSALKNIGVNDGCCSLGVIGGVDYCHNEYPKNSHGKNY